MKQQFARAIIAFALLAISTITAASADEAKAIPASYSIHVHITKVDSVSGKVTIVNDANLAAVDGETAPFQLVQDTAYIASVSNTIDAKGKKLSESVSPGQAEAGLKVDVTPTTMPDGKVKIDYAVDLSTLTAMRSLTVDGNTIQLPTIEEQKAHGSAVVGIGSPITLKAGDKMVLITVNKA